MSVYASMPDKLDALRKLQHSMEQDALKYAGSDRGPALRDATVALGAILDKPVADFSEPEPEDNTADMSVTVRWPAGRGAMQSVVYGRDAAPDPDTLTPLDRRIVQTLLEHALSQAPRPPAQGGLFPGGLVPGRLPKGTL